MDFFIFTLYQIISISSEFNLLVTFNANRESTFLPPLYGNAWSKVNGKGKMWEYKHTLFTDPPLAELFVSLDGRTKQSEKNCANLRRSKLSWREGRVNTQARTLFVRTNCFLPHLTPGLQLHNELHNAVQCRKKCCSFLNVSAQNFCLLLCLRLRCVRLLHNKFFNRHRQLGRIHVSLILFERLPVDQAT